MILIDTSVWINHLRLGNSLLVDLVFNNRVYMHPMVLGELACGNFQNRKENLEIWKNFPKIEEIAHELALEFIENQAMMRLGLGYIDVHLLCSAYHSPDTKIWTCDNKLQRAAIKLNINY